MMTRDESELLTRTGSSTPCGELLRRYWQPVALSGELPPGGAPKAVRLLGEDLVLFRDDAGRPGLLGLHCSHRATDLSYGRVEDGGLRCIYHGWLYDIHGRCLDQPGEPDGGRNRESIQHLAYPCTEAGEIVFAYLGRGEPPLLPAYEALLVPEGKRYLRKYLQECNYLQANEGNIDPVHLSFLHRQFPHEGYQDRREGLGIRGTAASPDMLVGKDTVPPIEVEVTDFGVRIFTVRKVSAGENYLRVSNFVMPNLSAIPGETGGDGYSINWHVPIDDTHHWKYMITFRRGGPIDKETFQKRYAAEGTTDYRLIRNKDNRYLQDREEMQDKTYSGMSGVFSAHDALATESQGLIQNRTQEHLVTSDKAIVAARKLLLQGIKDIQAGRDPAHVIRDPDSNRLSHLQVISEVIPSSVDPKDHVRRVIEEAGKTRERSEGRPGDGP